MDNEYLVYFKIIHVDAFKTLFEILKDIQSDTCIIFYKKTETSPGYMEMRDLSNDNTILFNLRIDESKLIDYICYVDKYIIYLDLVMLHKIFKTIKDCSELEMYISKYENHFLCINAFNNKNYTKSSFKLSLSISNKSIIDPIVISYDAFIKINTLEFHSICKSVKDFGTLLDIRCTNRSVIFSNSETNGNKCHVTFSCNDNGGKNSNIEIKFRDTVNNKSIIHSIYEISHLMLFNKCVSISNKMLFRLNIEESPLCLEYLINDLGILKCFITSVSTNN